MSKAEPEAAQELARFGALVAKSMTMRALFDRALVIAKENVGNLLIRGENGSGRQSLARAIHLASPRAEGPFVVFDCRSVPEIIIERALFGFVQPPSPFAPSLPPKVRRSPFEEAHGGTLLIREISALTNIGSQRILARILQDKTIRNIGGSELRPFDTKVIVTTNRDLADMYDRDLLAEELLAELVASGTTPLDMPPLREHREDIGPMLESFLAKPKLASPAIVERLTKLRWPRNVAQLHRLSFAMAAGHFKNTIDGVNSAVSEEELLDAMERDPHDDSLRHVYGDLLSARGDPRGEFIHVQCQLDVERDITKREALETISAHLLVTFHAWEAPVREAAAVFEATRDQVDVIWKRGFVVGLRTTTDVLTRLDLVFDVAPFVTSIELIPRARGDISSQEIPFRLLTSPFLQRLRELKVTFPDLTNGVIDALASAWELANLDTLVVSGRGSAAVARLEAEPRFARDDETTERAASPSFSWDEASEVLLASSQLKNVRTIILDGNILRPASPG